MANRELSQNCLNVARFGEFSRESPSRNGTEDLAKSAARNRWKSGAGSDAKHGVRQVRRGDAHARELRPSLVMLLVLAR